MLQSGHIHIHLFPFHSLIHCYHKMPRRNTCNASCTELRHQHGRHEASGEEKHMTSHQVGQQALMVKVQIIQPTPSNNHLYKFCLTDFRTNVCLSSNGDFYNVTVCNCLQIH